MATAPDQDFFPDARNPEDIRIINNRCLIRTQDGYCVVMVSGIVLAHYATTDRMGQAHAMVSLVEQGWANQIEVAAAFDRMGQAHAMVSLVEQGWANQIEVAAAFHQSVRTVRRQQRRFEDGGLTALVSANGYPPGRARLPAARQELVHKLKAHGHSNCEIARRLGVSETAVRKSLRRLGWKDSSTQSQLPREPAPGSNPNLSAFSSPTVP